MSFFKSFYVIEAQMAELFLLILRVTYMKSTQASFRG